MAVPKPTEIGSVGTAACKQDGAYKDYMIILIPTFYCTMLFLPLLHHNKHTYCILAERSINRSSFARPDLNL